MKLSDFITTIVQHNQIRKSAAGNTLYDFSSHRNRYMIDLAEDFTSLGWKQFDTSQDAWYFGVWVNPQTYQTLSYAEGDISLVNCAGPIPYNREIQSMIDFYEEGFIAKSFDHDGETIYRQDRTTFFVPLEH